jgi:hypothetical protein
MPMLRIFSSATVLAILQLPGRLGPVFSFTSDSAQKHKHYHR